MPLVLAAPLVEAAAVALARSLAIATGGAVINEMAKQRDASAEKSKDAPIVRVEPYTEKLPDVCKKCPPDCGTLVGRNWSMSEEARAYQARITGFAPNTEWNFENTDFDGFRSQACLLLEAKARYDQFFDKDGLPKFFFKFAELKIVRQARRQTEVVWKSPPSQLHWHFMQPVSYQHFRKKFSGFLFPIQCFHTP